MATTSTISDAEARMKMRACALEGDLMGALDWAKHVRMTEAEIAAQRENWVRAELAMAETTVVTASPAGRLTATQAALAAVAAERRRQIDVEGWSADHDDKYVTGELAVAAACYALEAALPDDDRYAGGPPPPIWPWSPAWWKPSFRVRGLVKACAMLLAEIERLERKTARGTHG